MTKLASIRLIQGWIKVKPKRTGPSKLRVKRSACATRGGRMCRPSGAEGFVCFLSQGSPFGFAQGGRPGLRYGAPPVLWGGHPGTDGKCTELKILTAKMGEHPVCP